MWARLAARNRFLSGRRPAAEVFRAEAESFRAEAKVFRLEANSFHSTANSFRLAANSFRPGNPSLPAGKQRLMPGNPSPDEISPQKRTRDSNASGNHSPLRISKTPQEEGLIPPAEKKLMYPANPVQQGSDDRLISQAKSKIT